MQRHAAGDRQQHGARAFCGGHQQNPSQHDGNRPGAVQPLLHRRRARQQQEQVGVSSAFSGSLDAGGRGCIGKKWRLRGHAFAALPRASLRPCSRPPPLAPRTPGAAATRSRNALWMWRWSSKPSSCATAAGAPPAASSARGVDTRACTGLQAGRLAPRGGVLVCVRNAARYELCPQAQGLPGRRRGVHSPAAARSAWALCRKAAAPAGGVAVPYSPAAARSAAALSVLSQVNSGSSRPKWP